MDYIGARRIRKLADFLAKEVDSSDFYMGSFAQILENGKPSCGTSACAAGWAASIPSFRKQGYKLAWYDGNALPSYKGIADTEALTNFFHVSEAEAMELFYDIYNGEKSTPKGWAKQARKLVKEAGF